MHRSLYPILERLGLPKCGFHDMRRFRVTWLRKNRVPEDPIRFWMGHADKLVTDGYSQLSEDVEYRGMMAEQTGLGFALPATLIPVIPKNVIHAKVEIEC